MYFILKEAKVQYEITVTLTVQHMVVVCSTLFFDMKCFTRGTGYLIHSFLKKNLQCGLFLKDKDNNRLYAVMLNLLELTLTYDGLKIFSPCHPNFCYNNLLEKDDA